MTVIRLLAPALLCAAAAAPVSADVTLQSKRTETHGGAGPIVTNSTEYRKGLRMRTDSSGPITSRSTIVDAGTGRMITLWHEDKIAEVSNWGQDTAPPDRGETPELKQSITPTGRSRQIAGSTCVVYDFRSSARYLKMEKEGAVIMAVEGWMCLVKDGPGQAEFSGPSRAPSVLDVFMLPQINQQTTELGVPFATEVTLRMGGDAMTKEVFTYTTEVVSFSTAPIPDAMFEIPAGYQVIQR
jgi:hypothetical protein